MICYEEQMFDERSKMAMYKHVILCTLLEKLGILGEYWEWIDLKVYVVTGEDYKGMLKREWPI